MPETETSQFHKPLPNLPARGLGTKSGEPPEPQEIHLLVVEDDKGPREYPLGGDVYSIGRGQNCNIHLFSLFVSRRHATLVRQWQEDGSYRYNILDGDGKGQLSVNGITINGRKLPTREQPHELKNEDKVVFGPGVSAKYFRRQREERKTGPIDPFDITLIDPAADRKSVV